MWCVVEAKGKSEFDAAKEIEKLGITAYVPTRRVRIRHARKVEEVKRARYPGYLFAEFDLDHPNWPRIFSRRGVTGMIMSGTVPKRVPAWQMQIVRDHDEKMADVVEDSQPLSVNQTVKIIMGLFTDRTAVVTRADVDASTITVETPVFGKPTPIILPRDHVAAVAQ